MAKSTKKPSTKKPVKKVGKKTAKKAVARIGNGNGDMSPNQARILEALVEAKRGLTRKELKKATGIMKGYSRLVGTVVKDNPHTNSLQAKGYAKTDKPETENGTAGLAITTVTPEGRKALVRYNKG